MPATCRKCRRTRADVGCAGYCEPCADAAIATLPRCRHCAEPYVSLLGTGTNAGRFCNACAQYEGFADANQPQGEAVRLFTPAPAQMPGQEFFAFEVEPLPARTVAAFDPNSIRDRYRTPRFGASRENPGT